MFKDVLAGMDLSMAPVVVLVCFFVTFVGIGLWLILGKNRSHFEHMNALPLHDAAPQTGVVGGDHAQAVAHQATGGDHE